MTNARYDLSIAALKAHLCIAPSKDVRHYLNGIFLDGATGHLVSTDGAVLLATKHEPLAGAPSVIMPRDAVAKAVKAAPRGAETMGLVIEDRTLTFTPAPGVTMAALAVDDNYAPWRRVVPSSCSGDAGNYDPGLLSRVGDALQALGGTKTQQFVRLWQNGPNNPAIAMLANDVNAPPHVALIMPLHVGDGDGVTADRVAQALS